MAYRAVSILEKTCDNNRHVSSYCVFMVSRVDIKLYWRTLESLFTL